MSSIFSTARSESKRREAATIELDGSSYPIRFRRMAQSRSIAVSADTVKGEVRVTMPKYASSVQAIRFAQSKSDWLAEQFAAALPVVPIVDGAAIAWLGEEHIVSWSDEHPRKPSDIEGMLKVGGPENRVESRIISWMKSEARGIYDSDLSYYCARADLEKPKLSIGDARRRWGSCSGAKSIRLSWRLAMAPPMVRRSVVAHEVAHLRHMDHSKTFYTLLDKIFEGDRRETDRWLKLHGVGLHLIGAGKDKL